MRARRLLSALAAAGALLSGLGCSGGGCGCGQPSPSQPGMTVFLASGPAEGFQSLAVAITKVEALGPVGWVAGVQGRSAVDLVALGSGQQSMGSLALPAGTYTALRLTFEAAATAKLQDGSTAAVAVPVSQAVATVALSVGDLAPTEATVILDPGRSLQARGAVWTFLPVLQAVDRRRTASVAGRIRETGGGGVAGLVVTAQAFESLGEPRILRRTLTRADGTYLLDLLPWGQAQHVVTWAGAGGRAFEPRASAAFTPSEAMVAVTTDLTVPPRADTASVTGTLAPPAGPSQSDEVELTFGPIQAGPVPTLFIVGMRLASVGASETYAFGPFPQGSTYQLRVRRRAFAADGTVSVVSRYGDDLGFLTGITNVVDFQF